MSTSSKRFLSLSKHEQKLVNPRRLFSEKFDPFNFTARRYTSQQDSQSKQWTSVLKWFGSSKPNRSTKSSLETQIKPAKTPQKLSQTSALHALRDPTAAVKQLASKYRDAAGLQVEALWRQFYPFILGGSAIIAVLFLWKFMFAVASTFVNLSQGLAKYGFLALSSSIVAFTGLYLRSRYTINPESVYRQAMRALQVDSRVLEALGAPLSGSAVRAYVLSGGTVRLKSWRLGLSSHRCFLIFPVRGAERKGMVSVEAKKKDGNLNFKLLAVDVPTPSEDHRIYLIGDDPTYVNSGGVMAELRDPVVKAMAKQNDFEAEDEREEEEEKAAEEERREKEKEKEKETEKE